MRVLPLLLGAVAVAVAALGCGTPLRHRFQLEDLERLTPGASTRLDVERRLGPPDRPLYRAGVYTSHEARLDPPYPLNWLTCLVFESFTREDHTVWTRFDDRDVLVEAMVTLGAFHRTSILLILPIRSYAPRIGPPTEALLRRLEAKGFKVLIRANRPGELFLSLDAFLAGRTP